MEVASTSRLQDDHRALIAAMHRYASLMKDGSRRKAALLQERVAFNRLFAAHVAEETAALEALGATRSDIAADYRARLSSLRDAYSAHINRWHPGAIDSAWPAYVVAVLGLQRRLAADMLWEEQALHPLLEVTAGAQ